MADSTLRAFLRRWAWCAAALVLTVLSSLCSPAQAQSLRVSADLNTFICRNADEDSVFSNGDEPYLFAALVQADGDTIRLTDLAHSSVMVQGAARAHGNLGRTHVDGGDRFSIPADTGRFLFNMSPIGEGSLGRGLATMGIVVVAMEEDATPDSAAETGRRAFLATLQRQLNDSIRAMRSPDIASMRDRIASEVRRAMREATLRSITGIFSVVDPDDFIGAEFVSATMADLDAVGAAGVPIDMHFRASGVEYGVEGRMRALPSVCSPLLTIRHVSRIDTPDLGGRPDYYARVSIDGHWLRSSTTYEDQNAIAPNWRFSQPVAGDIARITIRIMDEDGGLRGEDDVCDINPRRGARELTFTYNCRTGEISGDVTGRRGDRIRVRGGGDGDRTEIEFTVEG